MSRLRRNVVWRWTALVLATQCLAALPAMAAAADSTQPDTNIFNPNAAPIIYIKILGRRIALTPKTGASETTVNAAAIENNPNANNLSSLITSTVAGAASAPSGEIHIRESHGQYSYYLDGAPLPSNVTGSFEDLINPKDIETLRVYTGGFPAQYGGQLAAVFDVTAKAGQVGHPGGFLQQQASGYSTYQSTGQIGATDKDLSFFLSGIDSSTHDRLSPLTQTPLHDGGLEAIGFGKFDYQSGANNRITLDTGVDDAYTQIPNTAQSEEAGQNDVQKEDGTFANLIWTHRAAENNLRVALYSHNSQVRYLGSSADLIPPVVGAVQTNENQTADYTGLRADQSIAAGKSHMFQVGFDVDSVKVKENFVLNSLVAAPDPSDPPVLDTITDNTPVNGGDKSAYAQDDWTTGRALINYGVRYDQHKSDVYSSQVSPRLNMTYHTDARTDLHANYDRLFQPASIEDVKSLVGNSALGDNSTNATILPERDDFFEVGWQRRTGGATFSFDTYYRAEKNTIDDQTLGATQIDVPINFSKGYARGLEWATDGPLSKTLSYYANYALSWGKGAGPIVGGLIAPAPPGYFNFDHSQINTASFGVSYVDHGGYVTFDGEYGSGFPYGQLNKLGPNGQPIMVDGNPVPIAINYLWVPPHITFDAGVGTHMNRSLQLAFTVDNLLNYAYVIKQAGPFSDVQWAPGRSYGIKLTQNF